MRKTIAIAIVLVLVLTMLTGCGGNDTPSTNPPASSGTSVSPAAPLDPDTSVDTGSSAPPAGSVVRVGIASDPNGLSPFAGRSGGMIATYRSIYEYLVDRNKFGGEMVGCLMETYEKINDTTYNLKLYDYIYDTAGNHFTASDVVFTMETMIETGNMPKLNQIVSVTALDEYTVQFVFTGALPVGELEALWSENPMVTRAAYEASSDGMATTPVGTTAYKVTQYATGSKIVLEYAGDYWQKNSSLMPFMAQHNVETIEFHIITEGAQRSIALETNTVDLIGSIRSSDVGRFSDSGKFTTFNYMENPIYTLFFNGSDDNPLASQALREAIAYGIDVQDLIDGAYNGNGYVAKTIGSPKYGDYVTAWDNESYFDFDLARAKSLMADAGYANGGLTLRLLCLNAEDVKTIATIIQGSLLQLGIDVVINALDNAMMNSLEKEPGEWDLYIKSQGSTDYLVNIWKSLFSEQSYGGTTVNFIKDAELQSKLSLALTPEGHTSANVNAFHNHVKDNCYAMGMSTYYSYVVGNTLIQGVFLDSRNNIMPGACQYNFS